MENPSENSAANEISPISGFGDTSDDIYLAVMQGIWWAESFRHCSYSTADFEIAHMLDHLLVRAH
jgi:hypothetical protein